MALLFHRLINPMCIWSFGVLSFTSLPQTPSIYSHSLFVPELLVRLLLNFKFLTNSCKRPKFSGLTLDTLHLRDEKALQFLKTHMTEGIIPNSFARFLFSFLASSAFL